MPAKKAHVLLAAASVLAEDGEAIQAIAAEAGVAVEYVAVPEDGDGALTDAQCASITMVGVTPEMSGAQLDMEIYAQIQRMPLLELFSLPLVGTDWAWGAIDGLHEIYDRGCTLANSPGYNAIPVAQHAVAGLLALWARFPTYIANQRQREWVNTVNDKKELGEQIAVVFGFGSIGREIGRLLRAIGLRVVGVRRNVTMQPEDEGCVDELRPVAELPAALGGADWLLVTVPHTPETDQAVNAALLSAMPFGGGLVNVGRGAVVDEVAVDSALRSGQLQSAYLDVFSVEPLPRSSPLWCDCIIFHQKMIIFHRKNIMFHQKVIIFYHFNHDRRRCGAIFHSFAVDFVSVDQLFFFIDLP